MTVMQKISIKKYCKESVCVHLENVHNRTKDEHHLGPSFKIKTIYCVIIHLCLFLFL